MRWGKDTKLWARDTDFYYLSVDLSGLRSLHQQPSTAVSMLYLRHFGEPAFFKVYTSQVDRKYGINEIQALETKQTAQVYLSLQRDYVALLQALVPAQEFKPHLELNEPVVQDSRGAPADRLSSTISNQSTLLLKGLSQHTHVRASVGSQPEAENCLFDGTMLRWPGIGGILLRRGMSFGTTLRGYSSMSWKDLSEAEKLDTQRNVKILACASAEVTVESGKWMQKYIKFLGFKSS